MVVTIKSKRYELVATRLAQAHGEGIKPVDIQSIHTAPLAVGDTVLVRATIQFADGRTFTGLAEVRAAASGAQSTNPLACAETSAVGRALAMSGWFGSGEGIAGAEEVRAATSRQNGRRQTHRPR